VKSIFLIWLKEAEVAYNSRFHVDVEQCSRIRAVVALLVSPGPAPDAPVIIKTFPVGKAAGPATCRNVFGE